MAPQILVGFRGGSAEIVEQEKISRIYAEDGKIIAVADGNEYILRLRLYELEERLNKNYFVRISNSEIINLKNVKSFDLSLTGTICVKLNDGVNTFVSRPFETDKGNDPGLISSWHLHIPRISGAYPKIAY